MGLKLKPAKCRSLSIKAGKSQEEVFSLGESEIASILRDKCHKFLGGIYTFDFSTASVAAVIKERVGDQLKRIDDLLVRSEYKVRIYAEYLLGSLRFLLSVHDLNKGQIKALDDLSHSYLKRWLGLPQCASWAIVHDAHGLAIKSFDHLYKECRSLTLSNIRFFSDGRVRHALDSKEEREGKWSRQFSPATYAKGLIEEVVAPLPIQNNFSTQDQGLDDSLGSWSSLEMDAPASPSVQPREVMSRKLLKGKIQAGVQDRVNDFWKEKIGHYIMQGDYMALMMEEENCISWKSFLWDIPQGVLKFAINAGINTLPTFDNLKRWGKRVNDRCPFCGNIQTLLHVLSGCSVALDQGRYTWRHNSVLMTIVDNIRGSLADGFAVFADLPGFFASHGGTIPPHVLVSNLKPDLLLINESSCTIILLELTCPWDANIATSHTFKLEKYSPLVADLSRRYTVHYYPVEISVRGQVSKSNRARLKSFVFNCVERSNSKKVTKSLLYSCSKVSLLCSYSIFLARKEPSWASPNLINIC